MIYLVLMRGAARRQPELATNQTDSQARLQPDDHRDAPSRESAVSSRPSHACSTDEPLETIREANVEKHMALIEQAGREGVQILCMQEIFTGPYFCAEQTHALVRRDGADSRRADDEADAGDREEALRW